MEKIRYLTSWYNTSICEKKCNKYMINADYLKVNSILSAILYIVLKWIIISQWRICFFINWLPMYINFYTLKLRHAKHNVVGFKLMEDWSLVVVFRFRSADHMYIRRFSLSLSPSLSVLHVRHSVHQPLRQR